MRHVLLFVCLCFFAQISYPAFERTNQGSRSTALGGSPVALHRNEWAASANPAALTSITQRTLSVFYTPRPFEMQELSHGAISFIEPTSFGT
ncbi:MAG: hypothetical protein HY961_15795, partial [Ignavibacteriae bacterium]|nr:hypothetical protein [Ignavibacteriota bacterium]